MTRRIIREVTPPPKRVFIDPRPAFRLPNEEEWQLLDGDTPYREIEEVSRRVGRMLGFGSVEIRYPGFFSVGGVIGTVDTALRERELA